MAEPPTKRARRTDSSAMWERNEGSASPRSHNPKSSTHDREERRRSRSRDRERYDRRKDRSRSRDRSFRDRDRDRDRDRSHRDTRSTYDRKDRDHKVRERSRSRERYNSVRDAPSKARDRSRSPGRNGINTRTRSPPKGPRVDRLKHERDDRRAGSKPHASQSENKRRSDRLDDEMHVDKPNGVHHAEDEDDEDALLRRMMGFTSFNTTHNKKIPGNDIYGVRKEKKTEYRQYMNRVGGFNRPLSPSR